MNEMTYTQHIKALNETAYAALRSALDDGMSSVDDLRNMAALSDSLVDRLAGNSSALPCASMIERIGAA